MERTLLCLFALNIKAVCNPLLTIVSQFEVPDGLDYLHFTSLLFCLLLKSTFLLLSASSFDSI